MLRNALGQLVVTPGERITLKVTKRNDIYLATVSPLQGGPVWESQVMQTPLIEVRTTTAPAAAGTVFVFVIDCNFRPDATFAFDPTDSYTVEITGSVSGNAPTEVIPPPPSAGRGFSFTT